MQLYIRSKSWWQQPIFLIALALIIGGSIFFVLQNQETDENAPSESNRSVTVSTAAELTEANVLSVIGTARAFSEAEITAQTDGQVTSVPVRLGQTVAQGTIIATLENASEEAALLQAEGAYEAAVAASAQSTVGVAQAETTLESARNNAVTRYKSAYNTVNNAVRTTIDTLFSNPETTIPGLRINGRGYTEDLNDERAAYRTLLRDWQSRVQTITLADDLQTAITYAQSNVNRTIAMVDTFLTIFPLQTGDRYSETELQEFTNTFTALRAELLTTESGLTDAKSVIASASETLAKAKLAASGQTVSAADGQVKQALGSLRSAQANYARTILRTPISGTINSLSIRAGDFISSFTTAAIVANNDALEIIAFVSDRELELLSEGDAVVIDGEYPGTITQIAPGLDATTKKTEVRIATEASALRTGDTVRITKETVDVSTSEAVFVPLTAVKFEREDGFLYQVTDNNQLQTIPVTLGAVRGNKIEVTSGLEATEPFVIDVRGLNQDQVVEVAN